MKQKNARYSGQNEFDKLKAEWDFLRKRRIRLLKAFLFETHLEEKSRIESLMKEFEAEQNAIEQTIYQGDRSRAEALRQEFREKQERLEQEFKILEQHYEERKHKESATSHADKEDLDKQERLKYLIEETKGELQLVEEELRLIYEEVPDSEQSSSKLHQQLTALQQYQNLLNEKLKILLQQSQNTET